MDVLVRLMFYFPAVAVAILIGIVFGWQIPVAFALAVGLILVVAERPKKKAGKVRAAMEYAGFALLGAVVGGLLLGGLGAIFGFVLGFGVRLPETTPGTSFRFLRRKLR